MHSEDLTKLSLAEFASTLGIHPLHFAGVQVEIDRPTVCDIPWVQYDWQAADRTSREMVARAIMDAEANIEAYLGFRLLPAYEVNEVDPSPIPQSQFGFGPYSGGWYSWRRNFYAKWGWFVAPGVRAVTPLAIIPQGEPPGDLIWSSGGYWEVGTVLVDLTGTNITDPEEIRIFYPDKGFDETWEIRPTEVTIATDGLSATIVFKRENAVNEDLWNALEIADVDGEDDDAFLNTVDVGRVYPDPSQSASLLWRPVSSCGVCGNTGCPRCSRQSQSGCLVGLGDPQLSQLSFDPATWDPTTMAFVAPTAACNLWRSPDVFAVNYLAGLQDQRSKQPMRRLAAWWRDAVAFYAAALLERPPCDCVPDAWEYWREDLSTSNPGAVAVGGKITNVAREDLINPFGTRRGMIYAWKRVMAGEAKGMTVLAR